MVEFKLRCQMKYPKRCDLPVAEKGRLAGPEKYKVFLMYQPEDNDKYLKDALKECFKAPLYFSYDSDDIGGLGGKFCKICKLAQACDFGIAVLSPEDEEVFLEVGMLIGMEKPCLYIVNENRLKYKNMKNLPFDIPGQIVIKYDSAEKLLHELEKEVPRFLPKVSLSSSHENAIKENIKVRIKRLSPDGEVVLKKLVASGKIEFSRQEFNILALEILKKDGGTVLAELLKLKFIKKASREGRPDLEVYSLEEAHRSALEELLL